MATPPDFSVGQVLTAAHMDAVGLWKVADVEITGSAPTTVNVNDCFSSNYRNYRILWRIATSSADPEIRFRLRVSSTDATTNYFTGGWLVDSAGTLNYSQNGDHSRWGIAYAAAANSTSGAMDIIGPNIAANTSYYGNSVNSTGAVARTVSLGGVHLTATAYTGFTLYASTGTMTGRILVYGYRD